MSTPAGRPPVYLLHGLLGTSYGHFSAQIRAWDGPYRVVPVDLPGHGRCRLDAAPDYLDAALAYVLAIVARFGAGRLVAASYLGGPLAVRVAAARPDLVHSLVLTGFAPGLDRDVFLALLAGFGPLVDADDDLVAEYDRLHGPRWRATLAAFTAHTERAYETTALVRPDDLGALGVDTLLINGTLKSVERAAATGTARYGPHVRGHVIPGAGHIASHDAPTQFNEAVAAFWRKEAGR
ncbi:alpha/beta fold hydrolase [Krasilnikovia sp. MM14-A1259]|uniref:alpha/beta fold hydrolase n=1 Tax=Krasilnikovia sp. MM14-A1259 TaxID=3373539 RepID=UPI00381FEE24